MGTRPRVQEYNLPSFSGCVSCDALDIPLYDVPAALSARLQNGRELRAMRARVAAMTATA